MERKVKYDYAFKLECVELVTNEHYSCVSVASKRSVSKSNIEKWVRFYSEYGEKGFDAEFGARPVKRVIQRDVLNPLSKEILSNQISTESIILLDAFDGKLVFRNQ